MAKAQWAIRRKLNLLFLTKSQLGIRRKWGILLLNVAVIASSSEGEQNVQRARIIWQVELDDRINLRQFIHNIFEPDVGVSSDLTRANPVKMAATFRSVYFFDEQGNIGRRVPLRRDTIPKDWIKGDPGKFTFEYATTAPGGNFYLIQTSISDGYDAWLNLVRGFDLDGTLRFSLDEDELHAHKASGDGSQRCYIAPNGNRWVLFYGNWGEHGFLPYLNFYDMKGELIKNIDRESFVRHDFAPFDLGFSEDGSEVILTGFNTDDMLIFDRQGEMVRRIPGDLEGQKIARDKRDLIKRMLEPEQISTRFQNGGVHTGGIAEFRLIKNRNQGVYCKGNTLYLFELESEQERLEDEIN